MTDQQISVLSTSQFKVCSLLAFECLAQFSKRLSNPGIETAIHACEVLNVPIDLVQDITQGKVSGLQNLSRANDGFVYETDYKLNLSLSFGRWQAINQDPHPKGVTVLISIDGTSDDLTIGHKTAGKWVTRDNAELSPYSLWQYIDS